MNLINSKPEKLCELCCTQKSKYICPRCGIPYCSLNCYKNEAKHLKCSESFYKDCVVQELKTQDPQNANKMVQVLKRFHEEFNEEELDSDDDEPLCKRLEGIDLDDADGIWKNLTEEERNEFKIFAKKSVDEVCWIPWWESGLVEEVDGVVIPDVIKDIPAMGVLTRIKPNDYVKNNVTNVIASYVWTSRLYNGDFQNKEIPSAIINLSSFLLKDVIFINFEQALIDVSLNACRTPDLFDGGQQQLLNKDVSTILENKTFVLAALSEIYKIFNCKKFKNSDFDVIFKSVNNLDLKIIKKSKRKIFYLLAFVNESE